MKKVMLKVVVSVVVLLGILVIFTTSFNKIVRWDIFEQKKINGVESIIIINKTSGEKITFHLEKQDDGSLNYPGNPGIKKFNKVINGMIASHKFTIQEYYKQMDL